LLIENDETKSRLTHRLAIMESEHRDLDEAIQRLCEGTLFDQSHLRRLKKRKLILKDEISRLQML
jgi:hypothetical protein